MIEYHLVSATNFMDMEMLVNALAGEGWEVFGGLTVYNGMMVQPMIRPVEVPSEQPVG